MALEMAMSVCQPTTLVQAEISLQLDIKVTLNSVQTFMVPAGRMLLTLVIY